MTDITKIKTELLDFLHFKKILQNNLHIFRRKQDSHKGDFGEAIVIGGSKGMIGGAVLAARATLHLGAGRVYISSLAGFDFDLLHAEIMSIPIAELNQRLNSKRQAAILCGCGLGQSVDSYNLLQQVLNYNNPLVLDADALNLISLHENLQQKIKERKAVTILTPHPLEAARLLNTSIENIQNNRNQATLDLAKKFSADVVLKGWQSCIVNENEKVYINQSGNPGLATAGSGDVLAGIILAFLAQGVIAAEALKLAVFLHGYAADNLLENGAGQIGMTASEIIKSARLCLNQSVQDLSSK